MNKTLCISGVCACVILFPFIQSTGFFHHTLSIILGSLLTSVVVLAFLFLSYSKRLKINMMDVAVFLFLIISSFGKYETYDPLILVQTTCLFFVYVGFRLLQTNDILIFIISAILVSCFLQSVYGALQYYEWMMPKHSFQFLTGSFPNQNIFAAYICIGIVICVGLLLWSNCILKNRRYLNVYRIVLACFAVWFACVIILTETRAVWMGSMIAIAFLFYIRFLKQVRALRKSVKITSVSIILGLFCMAFFLLHFSPKKDSSDGRLFIWNVTLQMCAKKPIIGQGARSFQMDYLYAQAAYLAKHPESAGNRLASNISTPFNEYLKVVYEHGLLGFIIIVIAAILIIRIENTPSASILKSCLIALAVISFFSYPFHFFIFQIIGIIFVSLLSDLLLSKSLISIKTRILALCVCVLMIFTAFYGYDIRNCKKVMVANPADTPYRLNVFQNSYNCLKNNNEYLNLYVRLLLRHEDEASLEQIKRLAIISPNTQVMCDMGDLHKKKNEYECAETCYMLAHNMVPAKFVPLQKLLLLYVETEQIEKAYQIAYEILKKPVKVNTNMTDMIKKDAERVLKAH